MTIQRSDYGCGDNSCIFGSSGGMGTNGGCRCLSEMPRHALTDRLRVQRGIMALREKIAEDAKVRAVLRESLAAIAAVRAQAAEAGIKLPKVRGILGKAKVNCDMTGVVRLSKDEINAALAELDAAEGKGEGAG